MHDEKKFPRWTIIVFLCASGYAMAMRLPLRVGAITSYYPQAAFPCLCLLTSFLFRKKKGQQNQNDRKSEDFVFTMK